MDDLHLARRNAEKHIYEAIVGNKEEITKMLQNSNVNDDELKKLIEALIKEATDDVSEEINRHNFHMWIRRLEWKDVVYAFFAVLGVGATMVVGYYFLSF